MSEARRAAATVCARWAVLRGEACAAGCATGRWVAVEACCARVDLHASGGSHGRLHELGKDRLEVAAEHPIEAAQKRLKTTLDALTNRVVGPLERVQQRVFDRGDTRAMADRLRRRSGFGQRCDQRSDDCKEGQHPARTALGW